MLQKHRRNRGKILNKMMIMRSDPLKVTVGIRLDKSEATTENNTTD